MSVIKECYRSTVVLRPDTYAPRSLSYFDLLFEEAKKDFPDLNRNSVTVRSFAGKSNKNTIGIQFVVLGQKPESYIRVTELKYIW